MHRCILSRLFCLGVLLSIMGCRDSAVKLVPKLSGTQVADRAMPATVQIVVQISATTDVPKPSIDMVSLRAAAGPAAANVSSPEGFQNLVNILLSNPARFVEAGSQRRTAKTMIQAQGSGVIFSSDGYIATNAHVVQPDQDDLKKAMVSSIGGWIEDDVTGIEEAIRRVLPDAHITDDARSQLELVLAR